jgi:hypothetical protein
MARLSPLQRGGLCTSEHRNEEAADSDQKGRILHSHEELRYVR